MCSGYQLQSFAEFCTKKGVNEFLEKPIRRYQLRDALKKYDFIQVAGTSLKEPHRSLSNPPEKTQKIEEEEKVVSKKKNLYRQGSEGSAFGTPFDEEVNHLSFEINNLTNQRLVFDPKDAM